MATALIQVPDNKIQAITAQRNDLLVAARDLTINDDASYQKGGALALDIAAARKVIIGDFADSKKKAYDAHRAICAQENKHLDALKEPDRVVSAKLVEWDNKQFAIREQQRRELEAKAKADAVEQRLKEAVAAEENGDKATADALLRMPVIPAQVQMPEPAKVDGISYFEHWGFDVTDPAAVPREFCSPDDKKIREHVNTMQSFAKIPGVRVYCEKRTRKGGRIAEPKPVQSEAAEVTADQIFG